MRKFLSLLMATFFSVGMFAATYTVAGSKAVLGSEWSETDANNDMTLVDGVYTLVKENVTLGANTYEYKVVMDHDWNNGNNAWPAQNAKLTIAEDGTYDVTFTFAEETKAVNAVAEKKGSAVVEKHYLVVGQKEIANGKNWDNAAEVNLMATADNGVTYTLTIEDLELTKATDYEYKIVEKGSWTEYFPNLGGANAKFSVEETAVYTIKYVFTVATSKCEVQTTKTSDVQPGGGDEPGGGDDPQPAATYLLFGSDPAIGAWAGDGAVALVDNKATVTLQAGDCEFKVVPSDWNWDNALGYAQVDAECSSKGISEGDQGNVKVKMAAAGEMTVEIKEGKLCVTGNFETGDEPGGGDDPQPAATYLLFGSDPAIGAWAGDGAVALVDNKATVSLQAGDCEFKVVPSDWNWDKALGYAQVDAECSSKGISEGDQGNVKVTLAAAGDMTVEIKDGKLCVTGNFVTEGGGGDDPQPVTPDGIYLSGSFNEWKAIDAYKFARNEGSEAEEFVLSATLAENDQVKVVEVVNGEWKWYPDGMDNAYTVDAAHAGQVTIYFQKNYQEDWKDFGGYIYIAVSGTGISNTVNDVKAVKFIENGQLFIIVNGATYTVMGQIR